LNEKKNIVKGRKAIMYIIWVVDITYPPTFIIKTNGTILRSRDKCDIRKYVPTYDITHIIRI